MLLDDRNAPAENPFVVMVANPASGGTSRRKLQQATELMKARGVRLETLLTSHGGHATALAREAAEKKPDFVMAAGGDGTVNEVANGLAGTGVPMAILPLGTTNVLALELDIPMTVKEAVDAALTRRPRAVSLGRATFDGQSRYFCFVAGAGYDAATVYRVNSKAKKLTGKLAYILGGLRILLGWSPPELEVEVNGSSHTCHTLIASNTEKYAGNYPIAPGADMAKPLLHLFLLHGSGRLDILRLALGILRGKAREMKGLSYITGKDIQIRGTMHLQLDGDYVGRTPARVTAVPHAIRIIY